MTGQNEQTLTLVNVDGDIVKTYLDREVPFLTLKSVQFVPINSQSILFSLGESSSYISFNPKTLGFERGIFSTNSELLSERRLLGLFSRHGQGYLRELRETSHIRTIRKFGKKIWIDFFRGGSRKLLVFDGRGAWRYIEVTPSRDFDKHPLFFLTAYAL